MILKYLTKYEREDGTVVDRWNFISGLNEVSFYPSSNAAGVDVDMTVDKGEVLFIASKAYLLDDNGNTIEKVHS